VPSKEQRIWIEEGCIQCFWCQNLSPDVFVCGDQGTQIHPDLRVDQRSSTNRVERSPMTASARATLDLSFIQFVADGCPAKVIKLDPSGNLLAE
jgi:ferredoxin